MRTRRVCRYEKVSNLQTSLQIIPLQSNSIFTRAPSWSWFDTSVLLFIHMEPQQNKVESVIAPLKNVTPLSKYLAMALFIILPFLGGWIGYTYVPEKVVEVPIYLENESLQEKAIQYESVNEPNIPKSKDENIPNSTLVVTDANGLFNFHLPLNWRLEQTKDGFIQIFNYPEPITDRRGWGKMENKIEGGRIMDVAGINEYVSGSEWSDFASVQVAEKMVFTLESGIDENWNGTTVAIPLPNDVQKFVVFTIYGDTSNIGPVLEALLKDFVFLK